jgi:tetrahydromethanopterin S-methyltransferase subunit G
MRPPSSLRAATRSDDHKAYVELANLQMARTRQTRIRTALQDQVERSTRRIQKIDEKVAAVKAEIQQSQSGQEARDDDGFAYQY